MKKAELIHTRLSPTLKERAVKRSKERGFDYLTEYVRDLIREDVIKETDEQQKS